MIVQAADDLEFEVLPPPPPGIEYAYHTSVYGEASTQGDATLTAKLEQPIFMAGMVAMSTYL